MIYELIKIGLLILIFFAIKRNTDNAVKISHANERLWHKFLKIGEFKEKDGL